MLQMTILVTIVVIIQALMTWWEAKPFIRRLLEIKLSTRPGLGRIVLQFKALPMAWPAVFDGLVTVIGGFMGLTGSTAGATAILVGGLVTSIILKIQRHWVSPKWEEEMRKAV
jgi:predicted anti-sigma-YlaC factor YlaD